MGLHAVVGINHRHLVLLLAAAGEDRVAASRIAQRAYHQYFVANTNAIDGKVRPVKATTRRHLQRVFHHAVVREPVGQGTFHTIVGEARNTDTTGSTIVGGVDLTHNTLHEIVVANRTLAVLGILDSLRNGERMGAGTIGIVSIVDTQRISHQSIVVLVVTPIDDGDIGSTSTLQSDGT